MSMSMSQVSHQALHGNGPPSPSTSSHSPSQPSLAQAATINAGLNQESRRSSDSRRGIERRRSSLMTNINLIDPALPPPGEFQQSPGMGVRTFSYGTADPHHQRAPSLGELHQELENEQEAQVNRLLGMIRQQQAQIAAIQSSTSSTQPSSATSTTAIEEGTPTSEQSFSLPTISQHQSDTPNIAIPASTTTVQNNHSGPRSPAHRPSHDSRTSISRQSSRRSGVSSHTGSPSIRPMSGLQYEGSEWLMNGGRDESAFYQAETQTLTRENQMLRCRIRELERQITDLMPSSNSGVSHSPSAVSPLAGPPLEGNTITPTPTNTGVVANVPKEE
ncbi:hypothetical protein LTR39_004763 [Cryomyces antarcticus]|nr:hypothetical protein LTR39_004763 [Cryomyces antarcticus]KAK5171533.1 hypothetical protein LTR04_002220 [Oleoguttula sp. CCFEE 6159]